METYKDSRDQWPYPFYEEKRADGPVYWDAGMDAWLVLGYDECRYVQLHEEQFRHPYADLRGAGDVYGGPRAVMILQGEEHHAVHNLLLKYFTPSRVNGFRQKFIGDIVERRLKSLEGRSNIDFATEVADALPSEVIAAMLGLDWQNDELMAQCRIWNRTIFRWTENFGEDDAGYEEAKAAAQHLNDVILPVVRDRRINPGDDLISFFWRDGVGTLEPWDEAEVLAQSRVMFFTGTDGTAHFLKNVLHQLVEHPEYVDELRGDDEKIANFGEEVLRFLSPVQFRVRVALEDVEIGGQVIRKGDRVHPMNGAANRDPSHYANPDEFQPDRAKKDHVAFNVGPRYCIGAALARGEATELIRQVLQTYDRISWDAAAEEPTHKGYMPRSFSPLNVVVTRA